MEGGLSSVSHAVYQNVHHFQWCTKYRYAVFTSAELINACEASIRRAAARHGISLSELSVMPDHVHCVAEIRPSMSVSQAEGLLKGASARELLARFQCLRERYWGGHLWSAGRFSRSVGDIGIETARHYVRVENDCRQRQLAAFQNPTLAEGESQPEGAGPLGCG
jgi:putative transposase